MGENQFKAKIYSFDANKMKENEINDQLKTLQSERNFILQNYPQNKKQALSLLDSRIIPDRIFLISNQKIDELDKDLGDNDLIALSNVLKHNARIICWEQEDHSDDLKLEQLLLSSYYEQRTSFNNYLVPKFAARVVILGPPNSGKTKLSLCLRDKMNLYYLNAAHAMNQHIDLHTKFGIEAEKIISNGKKNVFVSNELIVELIANDICHDKDILNGGYVLDNFPRTTEQAKALMKYGVKPNRIIILNAKDSTIIEKSEKCKYWNDNIETPGIVCDENDKSEPSVHSLLGGFRQNIDSIKTVLCDKEVTGCGVRVFDIEKCPWNRILELSYDFIIQPLPKN